MAYIETTVKSGLLHRNVNISLFFPCDYLAELGQDPQAKGVLTLLHGFSGSGEDWLHLTSAERYARDNNLILIAPSCGNSFYCNMKYGDPWFDFLTQEMPVLLNTMFRIPTEREKNCVAGLSMGGYGAMLLALSCPDRFAGGASFSGAVDFSTLFRKLGAYASGFDRVFGDDHAVPAQFDLAQLAEKVAELPAAQRPRLLLTCGGQDNDPYDILAQNLVFTDTLHRLMPDSYEFLTWPGAHEWKIWDRSLVYAIDRFFAPGYADTKLGDWRSEAEKKN